LYSIFYDLETSDQHRVGQILNYCFIVVDDSFQVVDECSGEVLISRLQLPRIPALMANRVKVMDLQSSSALPEWEAMEVIHDFLDRWARKSREGVAFVGYNSNRFDLPFLRTSLVRNGFPPYFGGRLHSRDILQGVRHLFVNSPQFPAPTIEGENGPRVTLTLEQVAKQFNLLDGAQTHESSDDVKLTIELARKLLEDFDFDIRRYEGYEPLALHADIHRGPVLVERRLINYEPSDSRYTVEPYLLHDCDKRGSALWVNISRLEDEDDHAALSWFGPNSKEFLIGNSIGVDSNLEKLIKVAQERYSGINLSNFFTPTVCDIEQHIYRIHEGGFSGLDRLCKAIHDGDRSLLSNRDETSLFLRYFLNHYRWGSGQDSKVRKMLKKYCDYRYGGEMVLSRYDDTLRHPTLDALYAEIEGFESSSEEDRVIQSQLREFYSQSDLIKSIS